MNYFLISNMYPDQANPGYGSFVRNVVEGLARNGVQCRYSALIVGRAASLPGKCLKYLKFYAGILKNYFRNYDFAYIHFPNHALPCLIPCYLLKKRKVVLNLHGEDLLYRHGGLPLLLGRMNDWLMKKADAVIVPSDYYKRIVLERTGRKEETVFVSPSGGINPVHFYPAPFQYVENKELHLGYVGRIDPNKGWREFVETVKSLNGSIPIKATVIGSGSETEALKKFISENETLPIEYIPNVSQDRLRDHYAKFDLQLFPSKRKEESLGLVGIEAMACGTPVIGSDIGGIPSYLKHGKNGYLVQPGNVEQIVSHVVEYSRLSVESRQELYNSCLHTAEEYYSDKVMLRLAEFMKKLH